MQPEVPVNPKPVRSVFKRIWNALRRRPFMKLSALLLAFVFWAVVIASDPSVMTEKVFNNATVTVLGQGLEALRTRGYTVMQDLTNEPITVKMRVEVRQGDYSTVSASSFSPRLDLSQQVTGPGKQEVKFTVGYENVGKLISFEPESIEIDVEPYTSRARIPVVVEQVGNDDGTLWIATPSVDPSQITVSGPKSIVDQVRRAVVSLPLNSLSAERPSDRLTAIMELQDANSKPVSTSLLRITNESISIDSAQIEVDVYPMRSVPISVDSAVVGLPAHGYTLSEVRITPSSILVAANQDVLDSIEALHIATPIDISGQSVSQVTESALRSISGVVHMGGASVVVEADILPAEHVHTYIDLPVRVMGLGEGFTAKLSHTMMSIIIRGDYQNVEQLKAGSIHLYVDATNLGLGTHTLDVLVTMDGTDAYTHILEIPRVMLTLTKSQ